MSSENLMIMFIVGMYFLVIIPLLAWIAWAVVSDLLVGILEYRKNKQRKEKEENESNKGNKM